MKRYGNTQKRGGRRAGARMLPILLGVMLPMVIFLLAGCESEPKTLEDYLTESPAAAQEIEESLAGLDNDDMNVTVGYHQNRIIITGKMKNTYKKNVLKTMKKSYKKTMEKKLGKPMASAVSSIRSETGIDDVTIHVIINNGDGKEIWQGTYPQVVKEEGEESEETEKAKDSEDTKDQEEEKE